MWRNHGINGVELLVCITFYISLVKNYVAMRKITMKTTPTALPKDKQRSDIWFSTLENVSDSEIHTRMCVIIYVAQIVITK